MMTEQTALIFYTSFLTVTVRNKSTDYDSLNPGHILLREKVLLQPLKIIIGPVHMVLPRPRQLEKGQ